MLESDRGEKTSSAARGLRRDRGWEQRRLWIAAPLIALPLGLSGQGAAISWTQAIGLGVVQGLTEFLPISSTGHLIVVSKVAGWPAPSVALSAVLELGSIFAVVAYLWPDCVKILQGSFQALRQGDRESHDLRLAIGIGLGTLPIVGFGLLIKRLVPDFEHSPLRSLGTIAAMSIVMSLLLAVAEWQGQRQRSFADLRVRDGVGVGIAQALAVIPGVSRSGATLTAGLFLGLERSTAARFSFLLAIPAIGLAGVVEIADVLERGLSSDELGPLLAGGIVSALVSYAAIGWLLNYLQTHNTWIFAWYRLGFGLVLLGALAAGRV